MRQEQGRSYKEQLAYEWGRTFVFDPERKLFIVGNGSGTDVEYPLEELEDVYGFHYLLEEVLPHGLKNAEVTYYLVNTYTDLTVLPAMKQYIARLDDESWRRLRVQIGDVIENAVHLLVPGIRRIPRVSRGSVGIDMRLLGNGNFTLQTVGDCACLGPEMHHTAFGENTPEFAQEYGLHNADSPWQRLSLYAGIGSVAWYAQQKVGT